MKNLRHRGFLTSPKRKRGNTTIGATTPLDNGGSNVVFPRWRFGLVRGCRRGVSLLEVLISIFVLSVGLLSVAALIPVANFEIEQGKVKEKVVVVGDAAFGTLAAAGGFDSARWVVNNARFNPVDNNGRARAFMLDPLFAANNGFGDVAGLPRVSLSTQAGTTTRLPVGVAEALFVSNDGLAVEELENAAMPRQIPGGSGGRQSDGRYSYMAMYVPYVPDNPTIYNVSVAVFESRQLDVGPESGTITFTGGGLSGGEAQISADAAALESIQVGQYILVGSTSAYRWYRVAAAARYAPGDTTRYVTLVGPDWRHGNANVYVFERVVGVSERPVQINYTPL